MEGRAQTSAQKRKIMEQIYRYWCSIPELRLGQLLVCASDDMVVDLFHLEDEELVMACKDFIDEHKK